MYKLKIKDAVYEITKENIKVFALMQELDRGITHGNIHDEKTAIEYLNSIGIEVNQ